MLIALLFILAQAPREVPAAAHTQRIFVKAAHLIDGRSDQPRQGLGVVVENGRIVEVRPDAPQGVKVIDLGNAWLLPGLIDAHTHVLLQGDVTAAEYDEQLLKESIPYRALRASAAARIAVMNGFTTIRDLETEGAMYADVDVKTAIARGVILGPRMFVATRAMAPTGLYPLLGYSWELQVPEGVQIVDGPENIRKAVREEAKYGADWIKFYADRKYYATGDAKRPLRSWVNFTRPEMEAIVSEAHRLGKKVAAHAMGWDGIDAALTAGVDSIEHGDYIAPEDMATMKQKGIWYVPTMFVGEYVAHGRAQAGAPVWEQMVNINGETFKRAMQDGIKIAFGTDVGGFDWAINPAKEFEVRVKWGQSTIDAIRSASIDAATLLDMQGKIGSLEPGKLADIIAVPGDPLSDITVLEKVNFVMKDGAVVKKP